MTDQTPAQVTKVDITVAGHQVIVEAAEPLDRVAGKALELFRATEQSACRIPVGFTAGSAHLERAEPSSNGYEPVWEPT